MTRTDDWDSLGASTEKHNIARYYDYLLGGYHNFAVDRAMGDQVIKACPDIRLGALANRAFLRRAVKFLCQQGVDQFLDLGSGIPTSGNVHEVAQGINPKAHIVYVDIDPVAVIHSKSILEDNPYVYTLQEDIRNIDKIIDQPDFNSLVDLGRPVGVMMLSVLHFITDEGHLQNILRIIADRLTSGSFIAISHYSLEGLPPETVEQLNRLASGGVATSKSRTRVEITQLFDGYELVQPGVVYTPLWRPESTEDLLFAQPERALSFAGVGRKP